MIPVLGHLVTEPVSQFQISGQSSSEFCKNQSWRGAQTGKRPMHNDKMHKYEFLRKPDLSISLIHRTLHKKLIFSSRRSVVNEMSYQNIYGFSLKIFLIFGNVVHLTANTRFYCFRSRSPADISDTDSIFLMEYQI